MSTAIPKSFHRFFRLMHLTAAQQNLAVISLIMVINAIAYGTIIPLLYPFATRFGLGTIGLSLLFASFSLSQMIATPILGRLSDRYGRKPVLLWCIVGSAISLAAFALADNLFVLFAARIIDGVTGGTMAVAQAAIADTTTGKERTRSFGIVGAAFGVGFLFGPALGGLLSDWGMTAPFWFATAVALCASLLCALLFRETLVRSATHREQRKKEPIIDWKKMWQGFATPVVGVLLAIVFLNSVGYNAFIIGTQSYTVDTLRMTPKQIGIMFTTVGIATVVMQTGGIRLLLDWIASKKRILLVSLYLCVASLLLLSTQHEIGGFIGVLFAYTVVGSPHVPLLSALLTERTRQEDQGGILGLMQSVTAFGQILGPLMAGVISQINVAYIFVVAASMFLGSALLSHRLKPAGEKIDL